MIKSVLYIFLTIGQFIAIYTSSYFKSKAWASSDIAIDFLLPSRFLSLSYGFFIVWMIILGVFIALAVIHKKNRELIILINIVVLPSIQFIWYVLN